MNDEVIFGDVLESGDRSTPTSLEYILGTKRAKEEVRLTWHFVGSHGHPM